jgi:hypothetical protein
MTIIWSTLPVELYGREQYGAVSGATALPIFASKAAGPSAARSVNGVQCPTARYALAHLYCDSIGATFQPDGLAQTPKDCCDFCKTPLGHLTLYCALILLGYIESIIHLYKYSRILFCDW